MPKIALVLGGGFYIGASYSPEVEEIIGNLPTPPSSDEKDKIADIIDDLVNSGNYDSIRMMAFHWLWDEDNALTNVIDGTAMTPAGVSHVPGHGIYTDGAPGSVIDSNFVPAFEAVNNYYLGFLSNSTPATTQYEVLMGSNDASNQAFIEGDYAVNNRYASRVASSASGGTISPNGSISKGRQSVISSRSTSSLADMYIDGELVDTDTSSVGTFPPTADLFIGGKNNNGTPAQWTEVIMGCTFAGITSEADDIASISDSVYKAFDAPEQTGPTTYMFGDGDHVSVSRSIQYRNSNNRVRFSIRIDGTNSANDARCISDSGGAFYLGFEEGTGANLGKYRMRTKVGTMAAQYTGYDLTEGQWHDIDVYWTNSGGTGGFGQAFTYVDGALDSTADLTAANSAGWAYTPALGGYGAGSSSRGLIGELANVCWFTDTAGGTGTDWTLEWQVPFYDGNIDDISANGYATSVVAKGSGDPSGPVTTTEWPKPTFAIIGDSISDDKDRPGVNDPNQWASYIYWKQITAAKKLGTGYANTVFNDHWSEAVYGTQMWDEISANAVTSMANCRAKVGHDAIIVQGGTNDFSSYGGWSTYSPPLDPDTDDPDDFFQAVKAAAESIVSDLASQVVTTRIWLNVTPNGDSGGWTEPTQEAKERFNAWLKPYVEANGYIYIDTYTLVGDPADSDAILTQYQTAGLHFLEVGNSLIADSIDQAIELGIGVKALTETYDEVVARQEPPVSVLVSPSGDTLVSPSGDTLTT